MYSRFSSISRFSAECDRLVPPVPKTRLTFVRTKSRAVSVNLFVGHSPSWRMEESFIGTEKETIDKIAATNCKFSFLFVSGRDKDSLNWSIAGGGGNSKR